MSSPQITTSQKVREAQAHIEFEEDPHRAALEDNPDTVHVSVSTWAAIFFLALSFGPAVGLGFVTVASVVLPVTKSLGGEAELGWVVGAWSLASAVSFSLAGPMSDVFGRRLPMLAGEGFTVLGCIISGVAQDVPTLIVGETFIGLGTGVVFVAYAGVPEMLPNKWRSLGLGILEGGIAVPWGIIATLLGNVLQEYASWRWIFYIGIIVEVIALAGTAIFYWPNPRPRGDFDKTRWQEFKEIDWIGLFLFAGGLTTFLIGVTWGGSTSHPWDSAGTIVPIVVGFVVTVGAFVYDFTLASNPMFPLSLFKLFRRFSLLIIILFISGMSFYSMTPLLPQGTAYMFTTSGIKIGVYSLPNTIMSGIAGVLGPVVAHKIGYIKWQLCFGLLLQATFTASTAGAVYPNKLHPWIWLPAFGVPIFIYITILSYAIASLHVPHSRLGVAMGLLGTFRSGGGAVGNAIFNTIFENKFSAYVGGEIASAALKNGLSAHDIPEIITGAVEYNLGVPDALDGIQGMTPAIEAALQTAVRGAYGHAFKITFLTTLAFTVAGLICGLFVEDPTLYMTNHVQSAMPNTQHLLRQDEELSRMEGVLAEEKTTGVKME